MQLPLFRLTTFLLPINQRVRCEALRLRVFDTFSESSDICVVVAAHLAKRISPKLFTHCLSDNERDQPDERNAAEADAKEDLELKDEDADEVRGGVYTKYDIKGSG